jgi:hypothetical protein
LAVRGAVAEFSGEAGTGFFMRSSLRPRQGDGDNLFCAPKSKLVNESGERLIGVVDDCGSFVSAAPDFEVL